MSGLTREIYLDGRAAGIEAGKIEGKAEGIEMGKAEGIKVGKAEGILKAYIDMVKDKFITIAEAAKRVGISEDEFEALVKKI